MAVEHEELRLSVTLDDQASAQLGRLQAALNNIGGIASRIQQINIGVTGLPTASQVRGLAAQAGFFGGVVSGITQELTKMGLELVKRATDLEAYSRRMVELGVNAQRASQSTAQFQLTLRDMARSGVGVDAATGQLQKFANAIGNLQREQSSIRERLLGGLRTTDEIQDMQRLIQRLSTSDRQTALQEAKKFSEDIRAYWTRLGQAERGAAAAKDFLNILGIPDLDRMEREIRRVSAAQQQMIDARMKDAKVYNDAVKDTDEAMERIGESLGAIALTIPGVKEAAQGIAGFSTTIATGIMQLEKSMRNLNTPEDIAKSEKKREDVATPGETGPGTTQERGKPIQEGMTPEQLERYRRRMLRGRRDPAPQQFMGGGDVGAGGNGPGGTLDMSSIGNIGDLLKADPSKAITAAPDDFAGTGWRGLPMSKNVVDQRGATFPGRAGDPVEDNTAEMEGLANELRRLNDFLAPSNIMNPAFHNAPQGGAEGESNPMELPANIGQPGGGAAAEARYPPSFRPQFKNKPGQAPAAYGPYTTTSPDDKRQAAVRYNNPGAAFPSSTGEHLKYGSTGYAQLQDKDKNLIARFTDPVLGAAYNFSTYERRFVGKPIGAAMAGWSGGHRAGTSGYDPKTIITKEMLQDPEFAVPYMMAVAGDEAAKLGITEAQMRQAHSVYQAGGVTPYASAAIDSMVDKPGVTSLADLDPDLRPGAGGGDTRLAMNDVSAPNIAQGGLGKSGDDPFGPTLQWLYKIPATGGSLEHREPSTNIEDYTKQDIPTTPDRFTPAQWQQKFREFYKRGDEIQPSFGVDWGKDIDESVRRFNQPRSVDLPGAGPGLTDEEKRDFMRKFGASRLDGGTLDRAASDRVDVDTSGSFSVNVNAPEGTTVKAEGSGVLSKTEVSRSMPMQMADNEEE